MVVKASSYSGNVITLFKDAKAELGVSNVNAEDMINQKYSREDIYGIHTILIILLLINQWW